MKWDFSFKWFAAFSAGFILFTIIGTLSHELGHYSVAKLLGYESTISYNSASSENARVQRQLDTIYNANKIALQNGYHFSDENRYYELLHELRKDRKWIILGGIGQTVLTGIIGLFILGFRKKKTLFNFWDFLAVFLSLFWLREIFNLLFGVIQGIFSGRDDYFGGDEENLAYLLGWPEGSISISLGVMGAIVGIYVVFFIVPIRFRLTFILSGLVGGFTGFYLWMDLLGPFLLP